LNVPGWVRLLRHLELAHPTGAAQRPIETDVSITTKNATLYSFCLIFQGLTLGNLNVPQGHSKIIERLVGTNETAITYF